MQKERSSGQNGQIRMGIGLRRDHRLGPKKAKERKRGSGLRRQEAGWCGWQTQKKGADSKGLAEQTRLKVVTIGEKPRVMAKIEENEKRIRMSLCRNFDWLTLMMRLKTMRCVGQLEIDETGDAI